MNNLSKLRKYSNRLFVHFLAVALLVGSWLLLPVGLPGTSNSVEAQNCIVGVRCDENDPNSPFKISALINRIDVARVSANQYTIYFIPQVGLTASGSCGSGMASFIQINGGACGSGYTSSSDLYTLQVNNSGCASGTFEVGYRVFAYIKPDTTILRKVHGSLTITPSDFSIGQYRMGYATVPGCLPL